MVDPTGLDDADREFENRVNPPTPSNDPWYWSHNESADNPPVLGGRKLEGFNRSPDYYSFTVCVGEGVGFGYQLIVDRYGNVYMPPGFVYGGVGLPLGGSATGGYLNSHPHAAPLPEELRDFLTGNAISAGAGFVVGGNIVYSPGAGSTSQEWGLMTPGAQVTWEYGLDSPMNRYTTGGRKR